VTYDRQVIRRYSILAGSVLLIAACSSPSEPADEVTGGTWTVSDCAVVGPATEVDGAPSGPGTSQIVVTELGAGAPSIAIALETQPAAELQVVDIALGSGDAVAPGDVLTVEYCGVGLTSRAVFDSSWSRGQPAQFPLDGLIAGWQEGLPGMQVGGQRLLVIPGELAYGEQPPPGIEPNETLVFVVELTERIGS
jgi:peptidylprolyl isomerase